MIVHRFMSKVEYEQLMAGKILTNHTRHEKKGYKTTSRGFCFFREDTEEAIHWLGGIVDLDYCVTLEFDDKNLAETKGIYADNENIDFSKPITIGEKIKTTVRKEYCRYWYCINIVKFISATTKYSKRKLSPKEIEKYKTYLINNGSL